MANKFRGVAELVRSDGKKYPLKFGTNAICKIEEKYDKSINDISKSLQDETTIRVGVIRTMLQFSMSGNPSPEEVGDLIDDIGMENIGETLRVMFGGEAKKSDAATDPQPASELTGASV